MENQEDNLDLLDLGEETTDTLPEVEPFSAPRPKRPWLLMGIGLGIIVLATIIIVAKLGGDSGSSISVDLDAPVSAEVKPPEKPVEDLKVPEKAPVVADKVAKKEQPAPKPVEKPVETDGTPIRVVEDRKDVVFNPDKPAAPAQKPAVKAETKKISAPATVKKTTAPVATANGSIYVQFGSYASRAAAQSAEQKMRASHSSLFAGKQFVILAAQVKGQTTYRLRVPFHSASDANGFCRNAKSDGLDCYVTK